jgi:hypothetical protein
MTMSTRVWLGAAVIAFSFSFSASASEVTFNGFMSVVGGKVLSGKGEAYSSLQDAYGCPKCFVADYTVAGVYGNEWTFDPDTTFGLQGNFNITDELSATAQVVARGAQGYGANLEWAYVSYSLSDTWTFQGGRKRLPLFYYSDFFDVGYAYTWVRAPADLYGWQIYAYDGLNALYSTQWGPFSVTGNVWYGADSDDDNATLSKLYYYEPIKETWKNMAGTYLDLNWDWLGLRFIYMQNEVDRVKTVSNTVKLHDEKQYFYGFSANVDWGGLIVRTEYNIFDRPDAVPADNRYYSYLAAVGYRIKDVTLMVTRSDFKEKYSYTYTDITVPSSAESLIKDDGEVHNTTSLTLRWDFMPSVALKVQYDIFKDATSWNYDNGDGSIGTDHLFGDSKLVSVGIDAVF